jgi:proteasome accessory factor A
MLDPERLERSPLWLFLAPVMVWSFAVLGRVLHRRARHDLLPHLASRVCIIGSGALLDNGSFALSERAPFVSRVLTRVGPEGVTRSMIELGHIFKAHLVFPVDRKLVPRMLQHRQRLQLSSSEANRAQTAELLKVGTTALVLDLSERGLLKDAPRLVDPVRALHAIATDPTLSVKVPLRGGGSMSALELQRWYQTRAASAVATETVTSLEAKQIVTLWGEVLDTLARDPRELVGVLDWPTKKMLLDANRDLSPQARRKIAIRYHELGSGYYERFERRGAAVELVTREDIERAKKTPPADTPAFARGHAIKNAAHAPLRYVSWERIIPEVVKRGRPQLHLVRDDPPSDDDA